MTGSFFIATSAGPRAVPMHFRALADELVRRGHRVVLLFDEHREVLENHDGNPAVFTWPSGRPTTLRDAVFLRRLVRQFGPDALIGNFGSVNVMAMVGWWMGVRHRLTWYHTLSSQVDIDARGGPAAWRIALLRRRKRLVYHLSTRIVAVSNAARDDVHQVFGVPLDKCEVSFNSLADPWPGVTLPPRSRTTIVCPGRLYPSKGQDAVIRAASLLKDTLPDVRVEFLGHGPSLEALERQTREHGVADRCTFTGKLPHAEALTRMAAGAVVVVPSMSEAFGLVTIEALAMATPVIATATGGTLDIVRDGVDGLLFRPGDAAGLAAKLSQVLTQPEVAERLGRNGRERFLSTFERRVVVAGQADWLEATCLRADAAQG